MLSQFFLFVVEVVEHLNVVVFIRVEKTRIDVSCDERGATAVLEMKQDFNDPFSRLAADVVTVKGEFGRR